MNTASIAWLTMFEIAGVPDIPRSVSVTVRDGHITLEGVVGWNYERIGVERAMKQLRGVRSVFNNILIKPYDDRACSRTSSRSRSRH